MKLYILRHGAAQRVAASDAERALTERGVSQVQAIADYCATHADGIERIICSPYLRARQTAAIFKEVAKLTTDIIENANITPDIPVTRTVKSLDEHMTGDLLMVSHQPLVSSLITYLVWGETSPRVGMDTASLACLEVEMLQPGMAELNWLQHVDDLR